MQWPKFNVHFWGGKNWDYLYTVRAKDEVEACQIAAFRYTLQGKYTAYPHIENFEGVVK